ncbi:hypothetical protein ACT009_14845 [Sphingomonas sp. Tas61C01]|uniref:hypothetical protein n=1 Tax=Sphingomonas sp. Tas61C01 TaxID=3458297 RepID=UPI00403E6C26
MALLTLLVLTTTASAHADNNADVARLPLRQNGGTWDSGHVQGIAVDGRGGYIYYSFTTLLAKYDLKGNLVGSLVGWHGHLGDLDFNPADGKVYGSLEYKKDASFYIAVIDVSRIDRVGIEAGSSNLFRTVYLPEVATDYRADLDGDGRVEDDEASPDHRYGCSGIDGVAFGRIGGKHYLTVAYGIYGNTARADNDHQVLLQYDISDWAKYASPLIEASPHHRGPAELAGKYFVRTGNTRFGVQNLAYDVSGRRWFMGVYQGAKPNFPNYLLFSVDADTRPRVGSLVGVPGRAVGTWARGEVIPLASEGLKDVSTGIKGWMQKADVGFQPVGRGLFYIATSSGGKHNQTADIELVRWFGSAKSPLLPITR